MPDFRDMLKHNRPLKRRLDSSIGVKQNLPDSDHIKIFERVWRKRHYDAAGPVSTAPSQFGDVVAVSTTMRP